MATGDGEAPLDEIKSEVKGYILKEFLAGADPDELEGQTPLITGGILDSITTVMLVGFLEERFGVQFQAHEMGVDHLNTIDLISQTVQEKS